MHWRLIWTTLYKGNYRLCKVLRSGHRETTVNGRTVSTDHLYVSIESANWFSAQNITTVGTLKKDKQNISSELFDTKVVNIQSFT